ncbi:MAG TPA: restriction endonuclease [Solirubrobacterales bacterium]|nr:restriction endonuclease [Solirubrobacterales bacterium]
MSADGGSQSRLPQPLARSLQSGAQLLVLMLVLPFVVAFAVYFAVTRTLDFIARLRHRGKLLDDSVEGRAFWGRGVSSHAPPPAVNGGGDPDGEHVFQYVECSFTGFVPVVEQMPEDEQYDAYRLARDERATALNRFDADTWDRYGLADPEVREWYRGHTQLGRVLAKGRHCIYCNYPLRRRKTFPLRMLEHSRSWNYVTSTCSNCGWWCVTHLFEEDSWFFWKEQYTHAYAVMQRYDPLALDTPLRLAREYLSRNQHKLARVDPFHFEDLVADSLAEVYGDAEIIKVGGRKDRGIDIKAVRTDGGTTLIQVKRRSDFSRSEAVQTVRELHGVMLREDTPHGMVITTARDFSPAAREEVAQARRTLSGYSMELLPLADVVELLSTPGEASDSPWSRCGIRLDVAEPEWELSEDWIERAALPPGLADVH